jgi:hypothetical protein
VIYPKASDKALVKCGELPQQIPRTYTPILVASSAKVLKSYLSQLRGSSAVGNTFRLGFSWLVMLKKVGYYSVVLYATGTPAMGPSTTFLILSRYLRMVTGPYEQLAPTTSAPSCLSLMKASSME